jgi:hypothetical protein
MPLIMSGVTVELSAPSVPSGVTCALAEWIGAREHQVRLPAKYQRIQWVNRTVLLCQKLACCIRGYLPNRVQNPPIETNRNLLGSNLNEAIVSEVSSIVYRTVSVQQGQNVCQECCIKAKTEVDNKSITNQ